jgi:phospholipid/cholesterol/gamma-HCH transport system substrate-binding protein
MKALGAAVLLVMAALAVMVVHLVDMPSFAGPSPMRLSARFDNVGGLSVRSPVRTAGITIGHVTGIALDARGRSSIVRVEITESLPIPADSSVRILSAGLLGDQYIDLEIGIDDRTALVDGAVIVRTRSALVLEDLATALLKSSRQAVERPLTASSP